MNKDKIYVQAEGCLLEQMDEDSLLFNPKTARTVRLNSSSALVWHMCDGGSSVEQLIAYLTEEFPDQAGQIPDDVTEALDFLERLGVINEKE